jgi:hypothetical protein
MGGVRDGGTSSAYSIDGGGETNPTVIVDVGPLFTKTYSTSM